MPCPSVAATSPRPSPPPRGAILRVGDPYRIDGTPFDSAEEAWFWSLQAEDAKAAGARVVAGRGLVQRPCEPADVMRAVDRLYRSRALLRDHLHVLAHYGRRLSAPDPERFREQRAHGLWGEAFDRLTPILRDKGIVR